MATARMLSPGLQLTATWRNFQLAVILSLSAIGVGGLIYLVETYALGSRRRVIENPTDVMMRAFGLAHFIIGWLFLLTSPRLRSSAALGKVGGLALLGAAFCLACWAVDGIRNPLVLMAFYGYFFIHEIRDEANLFIANGDAPSGPGRDELLQRLGTSSALALMALLLAMFLFHGSVQERLERVTVHPQLVSSLLLGIVLLCCGASGWGTWRCLKRHDLRLTDFAPLLAVYGALASVLALGSLLGSAGFNLIILIHVMAWLVFVRQRLARQAGAVSSLSGVRGLWTWLRATPTGFITLHVVTATLILALMALRVYAWERAGFISQLLASSNFLYWGIMHITIAFWKK